MNDAFIDYLDRGLRTSAIIGILATLIAGFHTLNRIATALERQHAPQQHAVCKLT